MDFNSVIVLGKCGLPFKKKRKKKKKGRHVCSKMDYVKRRAFRIWVLRRLAQSLDDGILSIYKHFVDCVDTTETISPLKRPSKWAVTVSLSLSVFLRGFDLCLRQVYHHLSGIFLSLNELRF